MTTSYAKGNNTFSAKAKEKKLNDFISINLQPQAIKLTEQSVNLVNKFKSVNESLTEIIQLEKELKVKEMLTANKKVELLNLERKLKEKNSKKLDLPNILECYLIILKNNEELLNRRIEDLRIKDTELKQREFILSKVMSNGEPLGRKFEDSVNLKMSSSLMGIKDNKEIKSFGMGRNNGSDLMITLNEDFCLEPKDKYKDKDYLIKDNSSKELNSSFNQVYTFTLSKENEFSIQKDISNNNNIVIHKEPTVTITHTGNTPSPNKKASNPSTTQKKEPLSDISNISNISNISILQNKKEKSPNNPPVDPLPVETKYAQLALKNLAPEPSNTQNPQKSSPYKKATSTSTTKKLLSNHTANNFKVNKYLNTKVNAEMKTTFPQPTAEDSCRLQTAVESKVLFPVTNNKSASNSSLNFNEINAGTKSSTQKPAFNKPGKKTLVNPNVKKEADNKDTIHISAQTSVSNTAHNIETTMEKSTINENIIQDKPQLQLHFNKAQNVFEERSIQREEEDNLKAQNEMLRRIQQAEAEELRSKLEEDKKQEEIRIKLEEAKKQEEIWSKLEEKRKEEIKLKLEEEKKQEQLRSKLEEEKKQEELRLKLAEEKKQEEIKLEEEKKQEELRSKLEEEKKQEELRSKLEEEKKQEELRIKLAEEKKQEELRIKLAEEKKQEEIRSKLEEEKRKEELKLKLEEEKRKKELKLKLAEEKKQEEIRIKLAEEKKQEELRLKLAEEKKQEEIRLKQKKEEEKRLKLTEEKRMEEIRLKQKQEEELLVKLAEEKRTEELRLKLEEEKRQNELRLKLEEEKRLKLEEEKRQNELRLKLEEEKRLKLEEEKRQEEFRLKLEEEKRQNELRLKLEEEKRLKLEEEKRQNELRLKLEEEKRLKLEEEKRQEEFRLKLEEEKKQEELRSKLEEDKRKEELRLKLEEEKRKEQLRLKLAEEKRKEEIRSKLEEDKRKEELRIKLEEEKRIEEIRIKLADEKRLEEIRLKQNEELRLKLAEEKRLEELRLKQKQEEELRLKLAEEKRLEELRLKQKQEEELRLKLAEEKRLEELRLKQKQEEELRLKLAEEKRLEEEKRLKQEEEKRVKQKKVEELRLKQEEEELRLKKKQEEELKLKLKLEEEKKQEELRLFKQKQEEELKLKLAEEKQIKELRHKLEGNNKPENAGEKEQVRNNTKQKKPSNTDLNPEQDKSKPSAINSNNNNSSRFKINSSILGRKSDVSRNTTSMNKIQSGSSSEGGPINKRLDRSKSWNNRAEEKISNSIDEEDLQQQENVLVEPKSSNIDSTSSKSNNQTLKENMQIKTESGDRTIFPNDAVNFDSKSSINSKNRPLNDNQTNYLADDFESEEDVEGESEKMRYYAEYVKKMQDMAEETKQIESSMKQFANQLQGLVNSPNSSNVAYYA